MTTMSARSVAIRLQLAYMATAAAAASGNQYPDCDAGSMFSRLSEEFRNGYNGVDHDHPYSEMWQSIQRWYKRQGYNELCDAELLDCYRAAFAVGFTTKDGVKVPAQAVQAACKRWADNGWFRYEHQHAGRMKTARRVAMVGAILLCPQLATEL